MLTNSNFQSNILAEDLDYILAKTHGFWENLRGKKMFITGGTGFFGSWLLESFAWANEKLNLKASVLVLTRNVTAFKERMPHLANNPAIKFLEGDVKNFQFPKEKFSFVIHAAAPSAEATFNNEDPLISAETILGGTRHTLDFAVKSGTKSFIFISTGAVYGKQPESLKYIPEDYIGQPNPSDIKSVWIEAKKMAEYLCSYYSKKYGIKTKIVRPFSFVGPYLPLDIHYAVGNFIRDGLNGGPIVVNGDGTPFRSYLYAADLAIWLWTILFKGKVNYLYNIGSEKAITIKDLAQIVAKSFPNQIKVKILKKPNAKIPSERYIPSTKRARIELGLKEGINLKDAIQKTVLYCQQTMTKLKSVEIIKRNKLQKEKPDVYKKVMQYAEKVKKGESIAIIQFQYDYTCNFNCRHCCITKLRQPAGKRGFTIKDVKELSRQADEMGLAQFTITGGEPLVFPDLDQLVKAINPRKFYIACDSNGWYLDEKKALHLKKIGVDKIQLSLDSLIEKDHDDFRRAPGAYKRAIRAIEAAQKAGLSIIVQTVVTKQRIHSKEFINFLKFLNDKNVGVFVSYAKPVGNWERNFQALVTKKDMDYMRKLEKTYNVFTHLTPSYGLNLGCISVKRMISVTKYGDVMPCPYIHISLGNFFKEPLKKIVERGLKIKWFGKRINTCLIGEDRNFIKKYIVKKLYGKPLPVPYSEVFTEEDFIK
jgi:nucleoside-diphosphate-sugar epimerase/MoaA/NifB/PqqE/SkfB family radical SAM enzyme